MKNNVKLIISLLITISFWSCKTRTIVNSEKGSAIEDYSNFDFTIAFGSGNNQRKENPFWKDILDHKPNVWIWGGDNIYCDTEDMEVLRKCYAVQKNKPDYRNFSKNIEVIGVWDDHDYGVNDGGAEYPKKEASQQLFLDFLNVSKKAAIREQKGTYTSKTYEVKGLKINIILLDTRYFRTAITEDKDTKKRYKPNIDGQGTMLGEMQWKWLGNELTTSDADYNIIVSSIQFLSNQHGFEAWGNMPHEVEKMENIIVNSEAKRVIILSGDRHISEVSQKEIGKNKFRLIDFTSSGLTHSYTKFSTEFNPYRVSKVVFQKSYGLVKFNLSTSKVIFEMWGENNSLLESYKMKL